MTYETDCDFQRAFSAPFDRLPMRPRASVRGPIQFPLLGNVFHPHTPHRPLGDDENEWNTSERVVHGAVAGDVGSERLDTDQ